MCTHIHTTLTLFEQEGHHRNTRTPRPGAAEICLFLPRTAVLLGRSKSQDGGDKDKDLHRIFHKESTRTVYNHLLKRSVVTSFAAGRGPHQETQADHDLHMNTVKLQGVLSHMTRWSRSSRSLLEQSHWQDATPSSSLSSRYCGFQPGTMR